MNKEEGGKEEVRYCVYRGEMGWYCGLWSGVISSRRSGGYGENRKEWLVKLGKRDEGQERDEGEGDANGSCIRVSITLPFRPFPLLIVRSPTPRTGE